MESRSFRAMGTTITLYGPESTASGSGPMQPGPFDEALELVRGIFETEEQRFSRFRTSSELSLVNEDAGTPTRVSDGFAEVLALALDALDRTGGLFDPTVLRALENAGYDRDFDNVPFDYTSTAGSRQHPSGETSRELNANEAVTLHGSTVSLTPGVGLDLGGIAKGWTADLAAGAAASVLGWAMVDAGGDMRLTSGSDGFVIAIEDPQLAGEALTHLTLEAGALATSSTLRRRWGTDRHHIIDPRTAVPSHTGVVQATAWGATCAEAEVNAKWALLAGRPVLDRIGALLLMEGGEVITNLRCGTAPRKESA